MAQVKWNNQRKRPALRILSVCLLAISLSWTATEIHAATSKPTPITIKVYRDGKGNVDTLTLFESHMIFETLSNQIPTTSAAIGSLKFDNPALTKSFRDLAQLAVENCCLAKLSGIKSLDQKKLGEFAIVVNGTQIQRQPMQTQVLLSFENLKNHSHSKIEEGQLIQAAQNMTEFLKIDSYQRGKKTQSKLTSFQEAACTKVSETTLACSPVKNSNVLLRIDKEVNSKKAF